jgi:hypothetical protein
MTAVTQKDVTIRINFRVFFSSQNISMVDGNGEKVQSLIAVTFEGYDAGEVKFFTRN